MKLITLIRSLDVRQILFKFWAQFSGRPSEEHFLFMPGSCPSNKVPQGRKNPTKSLTQYMKQNMTQDLAQNMAQNFAAFCGYIMNFKLKTLLLLSFALSQNVWARDVGIFATKDFNQVVQVTQEIYGHMNPAEVLVVFDIDNTLLRLNEDFGSEQWFMWQRELIEKGVNDLPAITNSVDNLLAIQTWIYNAKPMEIVSPLERTWIRKLRNSGASVISLTSRSLSVREATIREIHNNSLPLSKADELGLEGEGQVYSPYRLDNPEESGLSPEDVEKFRLNKPKPVSFDQGVFFTQGQHKGVMLKTLLAHMDRKFKAIVFIDDRQVHIDAMRAMASMIPQNILSVHFNLSELWTIPFFESTKNKAQQDWCTFAASLDEAELLESKGRIYRSCDR